MKYLVIFIKTFIKTSIGLITISLAMLTLNLILIPFLIIRVFRSSIKKHL